jgi:copper chaperone CopZ
MKGMTEAKMANAMGGQCDYKGECANICLNIKGMTCTGCEKSVTEALKADKGVIKVISVDYKTGQAVVCYDPTKVESAKLAGLVTTAGYQAEVVPAVATSTGEKGMKKGASCDLTGKCTASTKSESKPISQ